MSRVCQNQDLSDLWDFQDCVLPDLRAIMRMRVFVRIRIYRICGIFRIAFRPARAFHRNMGMDKRLPIEDARVIRILKIL